MMALYVYLKWTQSYKSHRYHIHTYYYSLYIASFWLVPMYIYLALSMCCHQLSYVAPHEFTHNRVTGSLCDSIVGINREMPRFFFFFFLSAIYFIGSIILLCIIYLCIYRYMYAWGTRLRSSYISIDFLYIFFFFQFPF